MEQSNEVSNGRTANARCKHPHNKSIIASAKLRATAWKALHYYTMKQSTKPNSAMMSASAIPPKLGERVHSKSIIAYAKLSATARDALHYCTLKQSTKLHQCNAASLGQTAKAQ